MPIADTLIALLPEWAPNLHPLLVHFPIAIILLAVLMDLLGFFLPEGWWDNLKSTILYGLGTVSAIASYYTGTWAADSVFLPSQAQNILNIHAGWALWTVWFFTGYTVLRIIIHWFQTFARKWIRIAIFILAFPGVLLLYETGDHGAKLVFGYGVGTEQMLQPEEAAAPSTDSLMKGIDTNLKIADNGNWYWEIGPKGVSTLLSRFRWIEGTVQDIQPSLIKKRDNYLLQFDPDSTSNFFIGKKSYQNVQVDYYLNLSNFEGKVSLVNHAQDAQNYDYVTLSSEGMISQGRVIDGNKEVFDREEYSTSGMLFVRTVANGTHFRAYINKERAVHGHGDAPEAGSVGLRIKGSGTLTLDSMSVTLLH